MVVNNWYDTKGRREQLARRKRREGGSETDTKKGVRIMLWAQGRGVGRDPIFERGEEGEQNSLTF